MLNIRSWLIMPASKGREVCCWSEPVNWSIYRFSLRILNFTSVSVYLYLCLLFCMSSSILNTDRFIAFHAAPICNIPTQQPDIQPTNLVPEQLNTAKLFLFFRSIWTDNSLPIMWCRFVMYSTSQGSCTLHRALYFFIKWQTAEKRNACFKFWTQRRSVES